MAERMFDVYLPTIYCWLTGLDSVALLMVNEQQIYLFGQSGDHPYSDASPYELSLYFMDMLF